MGADGGVIFARVRDWEELMSLAQPWFYSLANYSAWSSKHVEIPETPMFDSLVGFYGTDCEYDLFDLDEFLDLAISESDERWDYFFEDFWLDLVTEFDPYEGCSNIKFKSVKIIFEYVYSNPEKMPKNISVREWAKKVRGNLTSLYREETWT